MTAAEEVVETTVIASVCEVPSCEQEATGQVTDYSGRDRGYCARHTRQMSNLAGWSAKEAVRRVASLWGQFLSWCTENGQSPLSPASASGFSQATGIDSFNLLPLIQQHSQGGMDAPAAMPGVEMPGVEMPESDEAGGLSDHDLDLTARRK